METELDFSWLYVGVAEFSPCCDWHCPEYDTNPNAEKYRAVTTPRYEYL